MGEPGWIKVVGVVTFKPIMKKICGSLGSTSGDDCYMGIQNGLKLGIKFFYSHL